MATPNKGIPTPGAADVAKWKDLLSKQTGSKIAEAWGPEQTPFFCEVRDIEYKKSPTDTRPTCFLKFLNLQSQGEEVRPIPDWFQSKLDKAGLLKQGSRIVIAYFGKTKDKKGQDVHDFRAAGFEPTQG